MVATTFSSDTPNWVTEQVRRYGVAGNWQWWGFVLTGLATVFFFARLWRRSGVLTDLEFQAAGMLTWPHSGFHVHTAVWEGPYGCLRMIARSLPGSRGTAPAIRSRWNGSPTTGPRRP
jgi:hypothetical protein